MLTSYQVGRERGRIPIPASLPDQKRFYKAHSIRFLPSSMSNLAKLQLIVYSLANFMPAQKVSCHLARP